MNMTAGTIEYALTERHLLPMSTLAACLTRIGRVDFGKLASSFFRFGVQLSQECRPRGVCNAFGKTMVMGHAVDREVFHADDPIGIDDFAAFLMGEAPAGTRDVHGRGPRLCGAYGVQESLSSVWSVCAAHVPGPSLPCERNVDWQSQTHRRG